MCVVNNLFVCKSLLTTLSNVLPLHLKQTFLAIIWLFTEDNGIESGYLHFRWRYMTPSLSTLHKRISLQALVDEIFIIDLVLLFWNDIIPVLFALFQIIWSDSTWISLKICVAKILSRCGIFILLFILYKSLKNQQLILTSSESSPSIL